jgi:UDP-N-acetyl-D-mannosaminuronate dehydrogenase
MRFEIWDNKGRTTILICGGSYRQDVGDTRYSGRTDCSQAQSQRICARPVPSTGTSWKQDDYPAPGHSLARFFRNQDNLVNIQVQSNLQEALSGVKALILAVPHKPYLDLDPQQIVKWAGAPLAVVDCFGILDDDKIRKYFELGCEVKAMGRGHIQRIKEEVKKSRQR